MSFDFSSNINPPMKAGAAYKDGSGMGGGGMYFQQEKKKRKDQPEEDMFQHSKDETQDEIVFSDLPENEIPRDNLINDFVNWFRQKKN